MPDLIHTLQGNDLGFLRMTAGLWGIELTAPDAYSAQTALVTAMLNRPLVQELVDTLPGDAHRALDALLAAEGRIPWAVFTRKFGEVRVMGSARRDRERPDLKPASPAEVLWYRAFIGKAFLNLLPEAQEFAYIPDDLLELLSPLGRFESAPPGRQASPVECAHICPANDSVLDQSAVLLAAQRLGLPLDQLAAGSWRLPPAVLLELLHTAGLLDSNRQPLPEAARAFLETPRPQALAALTRTWLESPNFNELRLLPGLRCEGEWKNDPLQARQAVLELLSQVPAGVWWNLASFVNALRERHPDFQRPSGDYDSWFIRQESSGNFLRGFASWDEVDGALARYLITAPLHALGLLDLAGPEPDSPPAAFRLSNWGADLWHGQPPASVPAEETSLHALADGTLRLPARFTRASRYVIARFCEWQGESGGETRYRLTPASLERARAQGLRPAHLISLLRKHTPTLPPSLLQALERWEKLGPQAALEQVTLLRLTAPEILAALRKTRAGRYLGEALTPTVVVLKPGGTAAVRAALAELGYLIDAEETPAQIVTFPPQNKN